MNLNEAIVCANNYRDSKKRWGKLRYEIATSELVAIALVAEVERLRGILQDVLDNDRFAASENANNLDDELKARIVEAIGKKKED